MKVRVQGNSIRLRLKQNEVTTLAQHGSVETRLEFGPDAQSQHLVYRIEATDTPEIDLSYRAHLVCIHLPKAQATQWNDSDQVGFECDLSLKGAPPLQLLIEKDFKCTDIRPDENECYPNPNMSC